MRSTAPRGIRQAQTGISPSRSASRRCARGSTRSSSSASNCANDTARSCSPTLQIESENDKFIDTLVKAIEQNIDNSEFGIQELCEISRYSYQQVYRKVKALTGESINEFIRTVRLKRAAQYLAQSDTRISEIMYSVGFNSHSYFTKCFREHFGLSPKEYAEKHRRK